MRAVADKTLQAMAKVVTNRRWAATATAMALGFGLFIGVAIGPGASGSLAGAAPRIVEVPSSSGGTEEVTSGGGGAEVAAAPAPSAAGGAPVEAEAPLETLPPTTAFVPESAELAAPEQPTPTREPAEPKDEEPPAEEEEPEGQVLTGTVVHVNEAAGSYALTIQGGELVAVHSATLPAAGTKLSLPVEDLANGTFAEEEKPEREGKATKARFTGTVTFADPDPAAPSYTVSGRGASVLVRVQPDPAGAAPALPPIGSFATVDVAIGEPPAPADPAAVPAPPACTLPAPPPAAADPASALWQQKLKVEDVEPSTYLEVAGIVAGVCPDRPAILLSADDAGDGADDLLLTFGPKIVAGKLQVGDSVLAAVEVAEDGTLTLTGLVSDERAKGADDAKTAQGDLKR